MQISDLRGVFFDGSNAFIKKGLRDPKIKNFGSISSAVGTIKTSNYLSSQAQPTTLEALISKDDRFLTQKKSQLGAIYQEIVSFREQVKKLSQESLYTNTSAKVLMGDNFSVKSNGAETGTHSVVIRQIAQSHTIATSQVVDTGAALSLSGDFILNEHRISVAATDSLTDVMHTINFGEDTDQNGILGWTEDGNNNSVIDQYGNGGTLYSDGPFTEDVNGNGELDTTEDSDGDNKMDGGTANHGVHAYIENNRLYLQMKDVGTQEIRVIDESNVLEGLGVITYNQYDDMEFNNETLAAQGAILEVDGKTIQSDSNTITDAIENLEITLREPSRQKRLVVIKEDSSAIKDEIVSFVEQYNEIIKSLNAEIVTSDDFSAKEEMRLLKENIYLEVIEDVSGIDKNKINTITEIGMQQADLPYQSINQTSLEILESKKLVGTLPSIAVQEGGIKAGIGYSHISSIIEAIGDLGIVHEESDTLRIDEIKLEKSIREKPDEVRDLFLKEGAGLVDRLEEYFEVAVNKNYGLLENAEEKIQQFIHNFDQLEEETKALIESYSYKNTAYSEVQSTLDVLNVEA